MHADMHSNTVLIPKYDKSRNNGLGDRCPMSEWNIVTLPVDIVILEGIYACISEK